MEDVSEIRPHMRVFSLSRATTDTPCTSVRRRAAKCIWFRSAYAHVDPFCIAPLPWMLLLRATRSTATKRRARPTTRTFYFEVFPGATARGDHGQPTSEAS